MRISFFSFLIFCMTISSNVFLLHANTINFSADTTLEVFIFKAREDISCESLSQSDPSIFKDVRPFTREKADLTNAGGSFSFLLNNLSNNVDIVVFARAINLETHTIYALACAENIHPIEGKQKDILLYLKPYSPT